MGPSCIPPSLPSSVALAAAVLLAGPALASGSSGTQEWLPTYGPAPGTNGEVHALAVFDDGSGEGPALFAGGEFELAGAVHASHVARWNGSAWSPLGTGLNGTVEALAVCDLGLGHGPLLYAAGEFTTAGGQHASHVAAWDGQTWSPVGSGMNDVVRALTVADLGAGPALFAGGDFSKAGGVAASSIARWDGLAWSPLGAGVSGGSPGNVDALAPFDDGTGMALYAGGYFTSAGGQAAERIARWDGSAWSPVGGGMNHGVRALTVFDDGSGAVLVAGGAFTTAGGQPATRIASWDGVAWSTYGSGMNNGVNALLVHDDGHGGGPALYAGGYFTQAGGVSAREIARWDGAGWSGVGTGMDGLAPFGSEAVMALASMPDGSGVPNLHAGGDFKSAGYRDVPWIARWDGYEWRPYGEGLDRRADALAVFDDGTGSALYVGGLFHLAGGEEVGTIARWDGERWSAVGNGLDDWVYGLEVHDDGLGGGPALYACGVPDLGWGGIARWNGSAWSSVGGGTDYGVFVLRSFDDGSGPNLYAGGSFGKAGGVSASRIARWDGASWSPLGTGMNQNVHALMPYDDGSGLALFAGGNFTTAGGVAVGRVARWDGTSWSAVGAGMDGAVNAFAVFDDGTGTALYAGGQFQTADGQGAGRVARWDGTAWSAVGAGMDDIVGALAVFDDGTGPALYAGGWFLHADGAPAAHVARWDGTSWSAVTPSGASEDVGDYVKEMLAFDDGSGPALVVAGEFQASPGGDSFLARWGADTGFKVLHGCAGNPAKLTLASGDLSLGGAFALHLSGDAIQSGTGAVFFGKVGIDAAGCGLAVPGIGELLLDLTPTPAPVGVAPLVAGTAGFAFAIPNDPALAGQPFAKHGAVLGTTGAIELSNALLGVIH